MDPDAQAIFAAAAEDSGTPVESTTQTPDPDPNPVAEGAKAPEVQESSSEPQTKTATETQETETKTVPSQEETKSGEQSSETTAEKPEVDWKSLLPQAPGDYQGKSPEVDENGNVTNMNAQEYEDYLISKAEHRLAHRSYLNTVENRALEEVEKILPEIKENPTIRAMIENYRVAEVVSGRDGDIVEAAKSIRSLLGEAKAQGAQNSKVHIETQQVAAVETGNSRAKSDNSKGESIAKRINAGDDEAFIELLDIWQDAGVV